MRSFCFSVKGSSKHSLRWGNKFSCILVFNHDILSDKFNGLSFVRCCVDNTFYHMESLKISINHKGNGLIQEFCKRP